MRSSLADALAAARLVSDRPELWVPGALVWMATVGWLPLTLVVTPLPGEADLAFFGAGLASSSAWPLNALAVLAGLMAMILAAFALAALGEAALWRGLRAANGLRPGGQGLARDTARLLAVKLVAALPVAAALLSLGMGAAAVAPDEFGSPDIGGDLWVRIAGRVAPLLVLLGLAILAGQALAAAAERRVMGRLASGVAAALAGALGDLRRGPRRLAVVAIISLAGMVAYVAGSLLLLRVLWGPIGPQLAAEVGIDAGAAPLLVGFVAIWFCLVLAGGALHAWASVWWTLELAALRARPLRQAIDAEGIGSA